MVRQLRLREDGDDEMATRRCRSYAMTITTSKALEMDRLRPAGIRPRGGAASNRYELDIRPRMSSDAANLKKMIDAGLIVHARLRETSTGDVIDLAAESMFLSNAWRSDHMIDALRELGDHGLVDRSETVSQGDSSEYLITWSARGDLTY